MLPSMVSPCITPTVEVKRHGVPAGAERRKLMSLPIPHSTTQVSFIPDCDYCKVERMPYEVRLAYVDGVTKKGPWAYMCKMHYSAYGIGLGLGRGQRLVLEKGV